MWRGQDNFSSVPFGLQGDCDRFYDPPNGTDGKNHCPSKSDLQSASALGKPWRNKAKQTLQKDTEKTREMEAK